MPDTGNVYAAGRQRLKEVVEQTDTKAGRAFDIAIQVLIVFSLITFSVDTLPGLSPGEQAILDGLEFATVMIFTAEYLLRIWLASNRPKFIFSFFGIIDLIAILPFYLAAGMDLRAVRTFRLLRLIRILKLARYSEAVRRFHLAFIIAKEELFLFLFVAAISFYLSGVGIYYFENSAQPEVFASIFHSLWWSVATLTTVGYGDIYPVTIGGKCFTFFVLIIGIGVVSVPAGLIASALSKAREIENKSENEIENE